MSEKPKQPTTAEIREQYIPASPARAKESIPAPQASTQSISPLTDEGDVFLESSGEFIDLQLEDYSWKIRSRKSYGRVLVGLLIAQNIIVFSLVAGALATGKMQDLQLIFGVLITATLGETAYMVKVIIEWLFKDINYPGN